MSKPEFVYTTYIETTPEKLWHALTDGDFTERYWFGHRVASAWEIGSPYKFAKQGKDTIEGKVLVSEPPKPTLTASVPQQPIRIPSPAVSAAANAPARAAGWEDAAKRWP